MPGDLTKLKSGRDKSQWDNEIIGKNRNETVSNLGIWWKLDIIFILRTQRWNNQLVNEMLNLIEFKTQNEEKT
jgi:hypothetical protein